MDENKNGCNLRKDIALKDFLIGKNNYFLYTVVKDGMLYFTRDWFYALYVYVIAYITTVNMVNMAL